MNNGSQSVQRDILFNFFNFPDSISFGNKTELGSSSADGENQYQQFPLNATSLILISQPLVYRLFP
jgi:hypothetical protein